MLSSLAHGTLAGARHHTPQPTHQGAPSPRHSVHGMSHDTTASREHVPLPRCVLGASLGPPCARARPAPVSPCAHSALNSAPSLLIGHCASLPARLPSPEYARLIKLQPLAQTAACRPSYSFSARLPAPDALPGRRSMHPGLPVSACSCSCSCCCCCCCCALLMPP